MATDDLTPLFRGGPQPGMRLGEGKLVDWNPDTFENTVRWQGQQLRNLTVLNGVEALTFRVGQQLVLVGSDESGQRGVQDWAIWSRAIVPGTGAAQLAIAFLSSSLAKSLSAEVFAERVHQAFVEAADTLTNQGAFTDLSPAGPSVSGVDITFGAAIVFVSCSMTGTLPAGAGAVGGFMGCAVSGATSVAADIAQSFHVRQTNHTAGGTNRTDGALAASMFVIPGLNAGSHTFTAKYRTLAGSAHTVSFSQRTLVVIGL